MTNLIEITIDGIVFKIQTTNDVSGFITGWELVGAIHDMIDDEFGSASLDEIVEQYRMDIRAENHHLATSVKRLDKLICLS